MSFNEDTKLNRKVLFGRKEINVQLIRNRYVSPLTWVGGKQKQWKLIKEFLPSNIDVFVDLFTGGGSVVLNGVNEGIAKSYIANDIDYNLINFFNSLKKEIIPNLEIPKNLQHAKELYDNLPNWIQFWYNNTLTFGGLYKGTWTNLRLKQNFTENKIQRLKQAKQLLKNIKLCNLDYAKFNAQKNMFFFIDSPYFYNKGVVYKHGKIDWDEFKNYVDDLNKNGNKFLMTIDDSPKIRELFKEFNIIEKNWKYTSTNTNTSKCKVGKELFVMNYIPYKNEGDSKNESIN